MSWSVNYVGRPEAVAEALVKHADSLLGDSQAEYEAVVNNLVALVGQNKGNKNQLIEINAAGYSYVANGEQVSNLSLVIRPIAGIPV